jgi:hypothetical protein
MQTTCYPQREDAPTRPGDSTLPSLADIIQQDLDAVQPDDVRASGIVLRTAIAWREGGTGSVFDPSGNAIDKDDGNKVAELLLRPGVFDIIFNACKAKFVLLHPDNWQLFKDVDAKPVVERVVKKILPLTNLQGPVEDGGAGASPTTVKNNWLAEMFSRFAGSQGAFPFTNIVMDLVEKQIDHVAWAKQVLNLLDATLEEDPKAHAWFVYKAAAILQGCKTAPKRHVFDDVLKKNGTQPVFIDALLRAGNVSEDKGEEIIDLLDFMDRDTVATFIKQDARVVHVNYFLRLYALRTTPITKRKAPIKRHDDERDVPKRKGQENQSALSKSHEIH